MILDLSPFDKALTQLGTDITANAQGAQQTLTQLADVQARLDAVKATAQAKARELREQGQRPIND
ncbi:MAG: hypothetical protein AAFV85_26795 [Cyanobacteria bacterium J06634_6]